MSSIDFAALLPLVGVSGLACVLLMLDLFGRRRSYTVPSVVFLAAVLIVYWPVHLLNSRALQGLVIVDPFGFCFNVLVVVGVIFTLLLNAGQLERHGVKAGLDVDVLVLLAASGAMVMVTAANLVVFFVGFELLSVCVYVLTGLARAEKASTEGALKYFILGAFSSAFLLYGITLVYGATGSMDLAEIGIRASASNPLLLLGLGFMLFGFGFKVAIVPFHFWTPDVYQGAPPSLAAFMAVVVKAAAFGAFFRAMAVAFPNLAGLSEGLIWLLAAVTMTLGNFAALRQTSMKRLLAYSSIAHAGYILLGLLVIKSSGGAAALFYLLVYMLMSFAAFGVVVVASAGTDRQYGSDDMSTLANLGWRSPFLGVVMTVALLSLAGMPPLGGFIGKLYLFAALLQGGYVLLAVIAALNSVLSLYYYLKVLVVMYFSPSAEESRPKLVLPSTAGAALALTTIGTLVIGVFSDQLFSYAQSAVDKLSGPAAGVSVSMLPQSES